MRTILHTIIALTFACVFLTGGPTIQKCCAQTPATQTGAPTTAPASTVELQRGGGTVPFELNSNKIYLNVKVNDGGPWPFVLDMGSNHSLLDLDLARELKLPVTGIEEGVHGAGEVPRQVGQVGVKALASAGLACGVGEGVAMEPPLAVGPGEARAMRGTLGFDLLEQVVVE